MICIINSEGVTRVPLCPKGPNARQKHLDCLRELIGAPEAFTPPANSVPYPAISIIPHLN